jgi:predicted short-subunit dehydrogenase-like oxidoreductase (DUF2520 family)
MKIVIIGSGNVAAVLGRKFKAAGHEILQVLSRNARAASELAYEWDTESANYISLLNPQADVYIMAVSDGAISTIAAELRLPGKVVAHTAASVSKDLLKNVTPHYGVFYPLQTLRKETGVPQEVPIFVEGSDEKAKAILNQLAESISPGDVTIVKEGEREKLHVAAVVVNNFTNHLYVLAEDFCKKEGLNFKELLPLIEETVHRLRISSPVDSQTGPASRNDTTTINKQLGLLEKYPRLLNVYRVLTDSIKTQS